MGKIKAEVKYIDMESKKIPELFLLKVIENYVDVLISYQTDEKDIVSEDLNDIKKRIVKLEKRIESL